MRKIVLNPKILSGKAIFEGTRIAVELILDFLAQGYSTQEIIKEYPRLDKEDIVGALRFAADRIREEKIYPTSL